MNFSLSPKKVEGAIVIVASGRLTTGEPVLLLRDMIRNFLDEGERNFVLDLSQVSYIDSAALGELVSVYTRVRNRNGDIKLTLPRR